jgi:hypothetical protein
MVVGILVLFLGLQLFLLGFYLLVGEMRQGTGIDWSAGYSVFQIQQGILLVTIMILVPAYTCIRLANERTDHNVDLMFISTLRPASIVWGKFFAAMVLGLLIFSACAPFMTFAYLLRGIDIPTILIVLGIDLLGMFFGIMVALFLASIPGGRGVKVFFCFIGFIQLFTICIQMIGFTVLFAETGLIDWMVEQWPVVAVIVTGILGFIGLLYFYCVAMISPPSANRNLPLRIYLFCTWLVLSVSLFGVSYNRGSVIPLPIAFLVFTVTPFLCIQLWISICERDRWAPRVARTIPKNPLLRLVTFLFYTGSAGGITYSVLLLMLTFLASAWWMDVFGTTSHDWENVAGLLRVMVLIALYTYCYGLTAILVRRFLLSNQIKSSLTWLIAALLVGLGSSVPSVVAYIVFWDQWHRATDTSWWALTNPFLAIFTIVEHFPRSPYNDFDTLLYWFLGIWGVLVTVLCFPWFGAQLKRFQPLKKRDDEPAQVILLDETAPVGAG